MPRQKEAPASRCYFGESTAMRAHVSGLAPNPHITTVACETHEPHTGFTFPVTLDAVPYKAKPKGELGKITNRLKQRGHVIANCAEFCEAVKRGQTFMCGCFEPTDPEKGGWGKFLGQRIMALDFDNTAPDGRPLQEGEPGYIDHTEALERCIVKGIPTICKYFTMSADASEGICKFRIVIDGGKVETSEAKMKERISTLLKLFPEADKQCKNLTRIFLGSNGEVHECWTIDGLRDPKPDAKGGVA